jgi:hypothetical protein
MITVTDEQVTEVIRAIVAEFGEDYVYPRFEGDGCWYVWDGKPSCLIGRVLHRLGADIEALKSCDDLGGFQEEILVMVDIDMSDLTLTALRYAQSQQDQRHSWGEALRVYLRAIEVEA